MQTNNKESKLNVLNELNMAYSQHERKKKNFPDADVSYMVYSDRHEFPLCMLLVPGSVVLLCILERIFKNKSLNTCCTDLLKIHFKKSTESENKICSQCTDVN